MIGWLVSCSILAAYFWGFREGRLARRAELSDQIATAYLATLRQSQDRADG